MLVKLLLITILVILIVLFIFSNMSSFLKNKHDNMVDVNDFLNKDKKDNNIDENELQNNQEKLNNRLEKQEESKNNVMSRIWSPNNTLESMITMPCLQNIENVNRLTCFAAPEWWYPKDKYNPNNFRSKYYRDSINPIYDYLGNAQDMYWDFKLITQ